MKNSFYSYDELEKIGFKEIGNDCLISRYARFYDIKNIKIGNKVRIDDFCILSGNIEIGSYVHISAFTALHGSRGIIIGNFSGISARTTIYSAVDDFSGKYLINPMVPNKFTNVTGGLVELKDYVQMGANTIVMPNIVVEEGAVTGAFTFINKDLEAWKIYVGIPAKVIKNRKKNLLNYVKQIQIVGK